MFLYQRGVPFIRWQSDWWQH